MTRAESGEERRVVTVCWAVVGLERVAWLSFFEDVALFHCPFDPEQRVVAAEVLRKMQARCRDHA